jgi:hypothetical protein
VQKLNQLAGIIDKSSLQAFALWPLQNIPGFPPIIQTIHILGVAAVMGSIVMISLRALGLALKTQPLDEMMQRLFPWLWLATLSNVVSGSFFVLARPYRYAENPIFLAKISMIFIAFPLACRLRYLIRTDNFVENQIGAQGNKISIRIVSFFSIILWLSITISGRWIAYVEYLIYPT